LVAIVVVVLVGAVPNMGRNAVESGRQYRSSEAVAFQRRQTHARSPRLVRAAITADISGVIPPPPPAAAAPPAAEEDEEEEDKEMDFEEEMHKEMEGDEEIKPT